MRSPSNSARLASTSRALSTQITGLVLLGIAALAFSAFRAGRHLIFTPGWWRFWQ